jgi:hypothetical protein
MDELGLQRFNNRELQFISEYVQIFQPFAIGLDILQGENNCFAGILLPVLTQIQTSLKTCAQQVQLCKRLASALLQGIAARFESEFDSDKLWIAAAALHPRFKTSWVQPDSHLSAERVWELVRKEIRKQDPSPTPTAGSSEGDNSIVNGDGDKIDQFFSIVDSHAADYLEQYKSLPVERDITVLDKFPVVRQTFLKYNTLLP